VVRVVEKFPMRFNLSPYYFSGEGFVLSAYAFHQNLFGRGIYGLVSTQLSSLRRTFELAFFDPRVGGHGLSWLSELHGRQYQYSSFASSSLGGGGRAGYRINDYLSLTSGVVFEEVSVDPLVEPSFLLPYAVIPLRSARGVVYAGATIEPLAPSLDINQVLAIDTKISYAGPASLSDLNFAEIALGTRWGFSFGSFVLRGKLGGAALFSLPEKKIAISDRYFLGGQTGQNSIRGYQIFSVGPWYSGNPTNPLIQIGGVRKFTGTVEFEFPIMKFLEMRGYLFSDFGNAYSEYDNITNGGIAASLGFGFTATAWRLPLKCEIALPVVNIPGALGMDFYIGLSSISL
jgi:outer membrane protein insertion porin family